MKKISRSIPHNESARRRTLRLSKEAIRMLRADDLAAVNGGDCTTTSYTTDKQPQGTTSSGC
jgi:hypothetical protein